MIFFPSRKKQGYLNIGVKEVDTVTLAAMGITLRAMYSSPNKTQGEDENGGESESAD